MDSDCDEPLPGAARFDWECDPRISKCPKKQYPSNRKGALINFDKIKNNRKRKNNNKNLKNKRKHKLNMKKLGRKWERQENRQSPTETDQNETESDQIEDLQRQVSFEPEPSHYVPIPPPLGNYYPHGAHLSKFSNSSWTETFLTEPGYGSFFLTHNF